MPYPKFIVFEGIDGSGKSTEARALAEFFRVSGYPVYLERSPSSPSIRKVIQALIQSPNFSLTDSGCQQQVLHLMMADRVDLSQRIKDYLSADNFVICDRYFLSSLAYNSLAYPQQQLLDLHTDIVMPATHFFLDITPDKANSRLQLLAKFADATSTKDLQGFETLENLKQVNSQYKVAIKALKKKTYTYGNVVKIKSLDDSAGQVEIRKQILSILEQQRLISDPSKSLVKDYLHF